MPNANGPDLWRPQVSKQGFAAGTSVARNTQNDTEREELAPVPIVTRPVMKTYFRTFSFPCSSVSFRGSTAVSKLKS